LIIIDILTDNYPSETTWKILNTETSEIVYSGGPYNVNNSHNISNLCFGDGCYTFTVYDSFGDGMGGTTLNPADGHITITNTNTSEVILDFNAGANYWSQQSTDFCIINTKDEENNNISNNLRIYPNPSSGLINFEFGDIIESISVYNNLGQLMIDQSINDYSSNLNIESLPQGIYLVKVNTASETIIKKVILNK
ncbi:MAG: T9SS type A sorting domain-containing protein, partial [Bacteroidales bacterium]|nr:T9SS type A sorting domain-containing protein [Bacteroidales bacterium]